MTDKDRQDNKTLTDFWDRAYELSDEAKAGICGFGGEGWKDMAPSGKLFDAASSLGCRSRVLDYGCGNAWAGIITAKSGCPDVTAVDVTKGAVDAATFYASLYGLDNVLNIHQIGDKWLEEEKSGTYDGFFCSNVLDVVPQEIAKGIIREAARVVIDDSSVIIGLNYYLSPERAREKGLDLIDGNKLYVDGVLRMVSLTDGQWEELFSPFFSVARLEHFAWPGEKAETRRLFYLRKTQRSDNV